jgi:hypothetical protein
MAPAAFFRPREYRSCWEASALPAALNSRATKLAWLGSHFHGCCLMRNASWR